MSRYPLQFSCAPLLHHQIHEHDWESVIRIDQLQKADWRLSGRPRSWLGTWFAIRNWRAWRDE
jgi:hypothetical protein